MNLFQSLPQAIQIEFSDRRSTIPISYHYDKDAPNALASSLRAIVNGKIRTLSDQRTHQICGDACISALKNAGFEVDSTIVQDLANGSSPVCNDITREALRPQLGHPKAIVAIGSGVINDLSKWLAADLGTPYAVLATAASMNGYSAANVAPTIAGLKSLFRANAPVCIAAIPSVIENAPFELTASGLGDVIAKPVSTADWILNNVLFDEAFSPAVAAIIDSIEPIYTNNSINIAAREPVAIKALFDALVFSGCAMTLQGSSLPASGGEHLISHTLDMMSHLDHTRHDLHGRQVGVATIFAAALYERFFQLEAPCFHLPKLDYKREDWGDIAPAIQAEVDKKIPRLQEACSLLSNPSRLNDLKSRLLPQLRSPQTIKSCLNRAGAAHRLNDIGCSRDRFLTAVFRAPAIRSRFTSLDLALLSGVLYAHAEQIIDTYLV